MSDWVGKTETRYIKRWARAITPIKSEKKTITMQPIR